MENVEGANLIPFDFQLAALVELRVLETNAAKLEIASEDAAIVGGKGSFRVAHFVDDLGHSDDLVVGVFYW